MAEMQIGQVIGNLEEAIRRMDPKLSDYEEAKSYIDTLTNLLERTYKKNIQLQQEIEELKNGNTEVKENRGEDKIEAEGDRAPRDRHRDAGAEDRKSGG